MRTYESVLPVLQRCRLDPTPPEVSLPSSVGTPGAAFYAPNDINSEIIRVFNLFIREESKDSAEDRVCRLLEKLAELEVITNEKIETAIFVNEANKIAKANINRIKSIFIKTLIKASTQAGAGFNTQGITFKKIKDEMSVFSMASDLSTTIPGIAPASPTEPTVHTNPSHRLAELFRHKYAVEFGSRHGRMVDSKDIPGAQVIETTYTLNRKQLHKAKMKYEPAYRREYLSKLPAMRKARKAKQYTDSKKILHQRQLTAISNTAENLEDESKNVFLDSTKKQKMIKYRVLLNLKLKLNESGPTYILTYQDIVDSCRNVAHYLNDKSGSNRSDRVTNGKPGFISSLFETQPETAQSVETKARSCFLVSRTGMLLDSLESSTESVERKSPRY